MSQRNRDRGKRFIEKSLNGHLSRGKRRFQKIFPLSYWIRTAYKDDDPTLDYKVLTEDSYDISLTETDYERLLEILGQFDTDERVTADRYYLDLEEKLLTERKLRKMYPALQKAYENYTLLLDLLSNGKDIND